MTKAQRRFLSTGLALLVLIFSTLGPALTTNAPALTAGTVTGAIVDPNGAVVPNANVTIANSITGYKRNVTSDADGNFKFSDVPPNNYQITVSAAGFSTNTQGVTVRTAVPISLKIPLDVSSATETVNVSSNASAIIENI